MHVFLRMLIIGAALGVGAVGAAFAADAADPVDGSWTLNVAKSKFSPGPAPQSQTRTYATTDQGVALSFTGVAADGTQTSGQSNYKYDGKDYPISGSPDFDTLAGELDYSIRQTMLLEVNARPTTPQPDWMSVREWPG